MDSPTDSPDIAQTRHKNRSLSDFRAALRCHAQAVETRLAEILPQPCCAPAAQTAASAAAREGAWPPRLLAAMRHGVFNGGKRLRPFLLMESAALFAAETAAERQKQRADALTSATALEAVHCYSLIHDDLPAMDDDDWRRGRPSVHKAYDEATAILAGNALLTLAFQLLSGGFSAQDAAPAPPLAAELCRLLAEAAGAGGMIGGQMLDILAENQQKSAEEIVALEMMKTGALLRFACVAGAALTQAGAKNRLVMEQFGAALGFVFQLADDILDETGSQSALGKTPGKDSAAGKATLVALYGMDKARRLLRQNTEAAQDMLAPFGAKAEILRQAAHFIAYRDF